MALKAQQALSSISRQLPVRECFRQQILSSFTTFLDTEASLTQIPVNLRDLAEDESYRGYLSQQSRIHRDHLDALKNQLSELAETEKESLVVDSLLDLFDHVDAVEKMWHLAEVFLLNANKFVSVDFAAWLQVSEYRCLHEIRQNSLIQSCFLLHRNLVCSTSKGPLKPSQNLHTLNYTPNFGSQYFPWLPLVDWTKSVAALECIRNSSWLR